ncbi:MAG TPA: hypothetical protein VFU49_19240 [Ktedonobacteraceae bacterium]|nr:hypothetical protein [Ktedonobacteraceae bacterium]
MGEGAICGRAGRGQARGPRILPIPAPCPYASDETHLFPNRTEHGGEVGRGKGRRVDGKGLALALVGLAFAGEGRSMNWTR